MNSNDRHLKLVTSDNIGEYEGPITRLGLQDRFPQLSMTHLTLAILTKIVLLVVAIRFMYF